MYLKEIKAHGFKSFADKTSIKFEKGITGIVGPNGSGKSNVVDAIRWVLGEQSVKSLRGDGNMADVIFSGSNSRGGMNLATVTLIFDNTDKYLPLDFDEISIRRRVYKDGTNEYTLNGQKVRLKDITNLLLDSGIAKESLNIISQGKIEAIISSKPSERRIIFEEAAGVLKYKRRKEEAIRKLDKTHTNINRVNDILAELEPQIEPLRKQKDLAVEYLNVKDDLENIELALITEDITNLNYDYQKSKDEIEKLNDEILKISASSNTYEANTTKIKKEITDVNEKIKKLQSYILNITKEAEKINSRKEIIVERQNYEVDDAKLHATIVELKEKSFKIKNNISKLETDISNINKETETIDEKIKKINKKFNTKKEEKNKLETLLSKTIRDKNSANFKIEFLKDNIENGSGLPVPVKSVLNNPKLRGIHNVIGNLIETEEKYALAISTALGYSVNNIVTDDEKSAKEAIKYLKNIGRATFFPLNIIKEKKIDYETMKIIQNQKNVYIANNLVKNDPKYNNIISNQLGNILVVENLDEATELSKKINFRYRIVTLSGEIIHVGGSLTGGMPQKSRSVINDRYELEKTLKDLDSQNKHISDLENKINEFDNTLKAIEDEIYIHNKDKKLKEDLIDDKQKKLQEEKDNLEKTNFDINSTNNIINGVLSKEEEEVIEKYYQVINDKEKKEKELEVLNKNKEDLYDSLEEYELTNKKENTLYNEKTNQLKDLEIKVNRMDVKLDNLLNTLTEDYGMTYEKAKENYKLDIEYNLAKSKVNSLKRKIKEIGIVNLAAPEEYERVSTRYEFLLNQITDLNNAENTLLDIINEMDKIMIKEFNETFKVINENFEVTFKELFKGGSASLKLTEPNNLLESGIEINCCPPGKKLTSISLLSGGEKTLTAISLLFAIIKSRPAPFCVLDEVEAALDEVNVDTFGKYITKLKDKSQFIIITHKKKTMEYASVLYGITMQESGVSKLVSVKLEDIEK